MGFAENQGGFLEGTNGGSLVEGKFERERTVK